MAAAAVDVGERCRAAPRRAGGDGEASGAGWRGAAGLAPCRGARRLRPRFRSWLRRSRSAAAPALAALSFAFAALAWPAAAAAQQVTGEARDFPVERFRWTFARSGVLGAEWAAIPDAGSWDLGLWLGTANDPLVLLRNEPGGGQTELSSLVAQRTSAALLLSYTPWRWLELGVELPLVLAQSRGEQLPGSSSMLESIAGAGFGDLRLAGKLGLLRAARHGVDVALLASLSVPSGGGDDYRGERGVAFAPELLISRRLGEVRLAGNFGYRARRNAHLLDLEVVDELTAVAAVARRLGGPAAAARGEGEGGGFEVALGLTLATAATSPLSSDNQDHVEALGGVTWDAPGPLVLSLIGGVGLNRGFGTPDWRGVLAVRFGHVRGADLAPRAPRALDSIDEPLEGEPAEPIVRIPDSDGDGRLDPEDRCPAEPETPNGYEDGDGCPDVPDRDGDGVLDDQDRCPDDPEDRDGHQDEDGCPELDNDGDGLLDAADACPSVAGPAGNGGCPDGDRDADGVVDRLDNCPDEPGPAGNGGCKKKQLVVIGEGKLVLLDIVYFDHDRDRLQPRSFALLDNVAAVLTAHPELTRIDVEGHTDDRGDDAYNKELSQRRAAAVVRYLESKARAKVAPGLLRAIGYGEERPVDDNRTPRGRARNRRVEFRLNQPPPAEAGTGTDTGTVKEKVYDFPDDVIDGSTPKPPAAAPPR